MVQKLWWRLCARIIYEEQTGKIQNLEYGG